MKYLTSDDALTEIYGQPVPTSLSKVATYLTPQYAAWVEMAKFCVLSTVGPEGTDGTPRGDDGPVVTVMDKHTVLMPDWAGNNRIDSLRNVIRDDRVSLMFMVTGSNNVVRVNGRGKITADPDLCKRLAKGKKLPRSVLVITIGEVYFQCAKAIIRSGIWVEKPDLTNLPTAGDLIKTMTDGAEGGKDYDMSYEARAKDQLWTRKYT